MHGALQTEDEENDDKGKTTEVDLNDYIQAGLNKQIKKAKDKEMKQTNRKKKTEAKEDLDKILEEFADQTAKEEKEMRQAKEHLEFVCKLYQDQMARGGWFPHEHPAAASS